MPPPGAAVKDLTLAPAVLEPAPGVDICASPTATLTGGGGAAFSLSPGDVLLLASGTYTGGAHAFPAGATLCVGADATFQPAFLNGPRGTVVVLGAARFETLSTADGFALDVLGTLTVPDGVNLHATASLTVGPEATATLGPLAASTGSVILNEGTATVSRLSLNGKAVLDNRGALTIGSTSSANGTILNTGSLVVSGSLTLNGGATFANSCVVSASGDLEVGSHDARNDGYVRLGGTLRVGGTWSQTLRGLVTGHGLVNDGTLGGYGRYRADDTRTQGAVLGGDAADPIVVHDETPPPAPRIFDVQSGTLVNVVAGPVTLPPDEARPPGCAAPQDGAADVRLGVAGPAAAAPGDGLVYTVTVTDDGTAPATGVSVTITVPPGLDVALPAGATRTGDRITWTVGTLAVGESRTLTLVAVAAEPGVRVLRASGVSTSMDPVPWNNDGTAPEHSVTTFVSADAANQPPTLSDTTERTSAHLPFSGTVTGHDPDVGQVLTYAPTIPAASGTVTLAPTGDYTYTPDGDFTGTDSFGVRVCDDGAPVRCADATVTVLVLPAPRDVSVHTPHDTPVDVVVTRTGIGRTRPGISVEQPGNGTVEAVGDLARYTPAPGFDGTDSFLYTVCSPDGTACADARVAVVVAGANRPPVTGDVTLSTVLGRPVTGVVTAHDPDDGQALVAAVTAAAGHGRASVDAGGGVLYEPAPGFAGTDTFAVTFCDDSLPSLCATANVTVSVLPAVRPDVATFVGVNPVSIPVLANDEGVSAQVVIARGPAHGTASIRPDGTVVYTAEPDASADSFTYRACVPGEPALCAEAVVTLITASNHAAPPPPEPGPTTPPSPREPRPTAPPSGTGESDDTRAAITDPPGGDRLSASGADPLPALVAGVLSAVVGVLAVTAARRRGVSRGPEGA